ncbi:hypothetical protein JCM8097_003858 [Rhodosporidiobolus ruineniae]
MRLYSIAASFTTAFLSASLAAALPAPPSSPTSLKQAVPPVPIVIWHGLGDRFDAAGLLSLKADLEARPKLEGVFVHIVHVADDGPADQRATFFGLATAQIQKVCDQLLDIPEITSPKLNPSGVFDGLGWSQGGQLLRGVVEMCGGEGEGKLKMRNLITVGSQHMGIWAMPPCPADSGPFSACRLMHLSLVREGIYSGWAQSQVIPAQYWREEARIDEYLRNNRFLRDINNERVGDDEMGAGLWDTEKEPRNKTYKENFSALNRLVLLRFSEDLTVVPPHSSHFTLPSPNATNCPAPPLPADPLCYADALPWSSLPLYAQDYIGLRALDEAGRVTKGVCEGAHMQVSEECWEGIVRWFGKSGEKGPTEEEVGEKRGEEVWYTAEDGGDRTDGLVIQL